MTAAQTADHIATLASAIEDDVLGIDPTATVVSVPFPTPEQHDQIVARIIDAIRTADLTITTKVADHLESINYHAAAHAVDTLTAA